LLRLPLGNGQQVLARDDPYSDRVRCDHPDPGVDAGRLGQVLVAAARERDRGRVVLLAPATLRAELEAAGLRTEALMPGFYNGRGDCVVAGLALDPARARPGDAVAVGQVERLIQQPPTPRQRTPVPTLRASSGDAGAIAALIAETFEHYPTPSGVPGYIAEQINSGVPFRIVRRGGEVVACASADLVRPARTAELTDCATRPDQRGQGLMQFILADLMRDLRRMDYPTAFTLARAGVAGVNLAFQRLGFQYRGRMLQSCRIGGGMEDMNVWSRRL
jgi:putative beta-lysine N-acetyltransferase